MNKEKKKLRLKISPKKTELRLDKSSSFNAFLDNNDISDIGKEKIIAKKSGIKLSEEDASIVKAMLHRGDRQHDIASWFGVNGGRIAEIRSNEKFSNILAFKGELPPPGPYTSGKSAFYMKKEIIRIGSNLNRLKDFITGTNKDELNKEITKSVHDLSKLIKDI